MTQEKPIIPIFFTIDNGYAPCLGVALASMKANVSRDYYYWIHIFHQELLAENIAKRCSSVEYWFQVQFEEMKEGLESITDRKENRLRCDYFTMTIYFRLFIPEMFPEYDKGIYIDSDIVVPGDISRLYNIQLGDNLLGACPDHSVSEIPEFAHYIEESTGVNRYKYINSGILLMNLAEMRKCRMTEHFLHLLNTYHFDSIAPDQDYINAMCYGRIHFLDEEWDAMPNKQKAPMAHPSLIHYNLFDKPWCYDDVQYEDYFWQYARENVYYQELLEIKRNYSDEQKKSDMECLENMLTNAMRIPNNPVTFKKIHESEGTIRL